MKRRLSQMLIFTLCLLTLITISCTDEGTAPRSSLKLSMESSKALGRTLVPDDTPLSVSRYVVEGDGPQGSTFSVVSTNATMEVQGLLIGNWNLTAVGQNSLGTDLVRGSKAVSLTKDPTETVIELDSLAGTGVMDIEFYWDIDQVSDATLSVWLEDGSGEKRLLTPKTNNSAHGSMRYTSTLAAGSYLVQAQLDSASIRVAGCVEVVRIVGARTTEARIQLRLDKYSEIPNSILLVDRLGQPIECTIGGISETMVAQQSVTATLSTQGDLPIEVSWYLDGEQIATSQNCTFTPTSGTHRLDVIAKGALLASSGSASISFIATVSGEPGIPAFVNRVGDNTNGILIGDGAQVAFLPDGKFLLASPSTQTLQVCRIVRDSVEVVHTYTTADSFNLAGVAAIFVDQYTYRVAVSNSINPKVAVYQYDLSSSTLTKLFEKGNNYGCTDWGTGTFPYLHRFAIDWTFGALYGLHPTMDVVVQMNFYATSADGFHNPAYFWPYVPGDGLPFTGMDISPLGEYSATAKASESMIWVFRWIPDFGGLNFSDYMTIKPANYPYLTGAREVCFLDEQNFIYATSKDVGRFTRVGTNKWDQKEVFTSGVYGTPAMNGITSLKRSAPGSRVYALCTESRSVTCFTYDGRGEISVLGTTSLGIFDPAQMAISAKGDHMVVTSSTSAELLLFRILE